MKDLENYLLNHPVETFRVGNHQAAIVNPICRIIITCHWPETEPIDEEKQHFVQSQTENVVKYLKTEGFIDNDASMCILVLTSHKYQ